jgi:hypothetical protein
MHQRSTGPVPRPDQTRGVVRLPLIDTYSGSPDGTHLEPPLRGSRRGKRPEFRNLGGSSPSRLPDGG